MSSTSSVRSEKFLYSYFSLNINLKIRLTNDFELLYKYPMPLSEAARETRLKQNKQTYTNIRELRLKHGWTQADIAEFTGYTRVYINKVELGQVPNPSITLIRKLAKLFNVTMEHLCM